MPPTLHTRVYTTPTHPGYTTIPPGVHSVSAAVCAPQHRPAHGALGSNPRKSLGGSPSARPGAQKCVHSYVLCARMLAARRVRTDKDWIATGGSKAQGALERASAQKGVIPGKASSRRGFPLSPREASRPLCAEAPSLPGRPRGLCAEAPSLSQGGLEASAQRFLPLSQGGLEASAQRFLLLPIRRPRGLCAEVSPIP